MTVRLGKDVFSPYSWPSFKFPGRCSSSLYSILLTQHIISTNHTFFLTLNTRSSKHYIHVDTVLKVIINNHVDEKYINHVIIYICSSCWTWLIKSRCNDRIQFPFMEYLCLAQFWNTWVFREKHPKYIHVVHIRFEIMHMHTCYTTLLSLPIHFRCENSENKDSSENKIGIRFWYCRNIRDELKGTENY